MPFAPDSRLQFAAPLSPHARYLLACAIVAAATGLRGAIDPLIGAQIPYFIYVAAVVVATWFCGVDGGVLSTLIAAFAGNYFFVQPRYEFVPHAQDWVAMGLFAVVALGLVWLVGQWKNSELALRQVIIGQKSAGQALRRQAEELQAILDTVPAAVFVTRDPDARRMDGNRFTAEYLRLPQGANMSKTAPQAERPTFRVMKEGRELTGDDLPVQKAMAIGRELRDLEFDIVFEDGTSRTLYGNATPLRDESGNIRGSIGAFVDITERKRSEDVLRDANRVKDEFLATLSHELRTPLNAIVGWSSMLVQGGLPPEAVRRAHDAIFRNAEVQRNLIDDVLDVSRIISGKMRLEPGQTDLSVPVRAAIEAVRLAADAKRIAIVTTVAPGPLWVSGDTGRLQQVFWNLLTNAVKFTEAGGTITVATARADSQVQVSVSDTGIGIEPEFLPHVFERFRQRDSSPTRSHGGLGLGLSIVRHLVELHGGTVEAHSEGLGRGSRFTVALPVSAYEDRRHGAPLVPRHVSAIAVGSADPPSLCGVRVLVVDDEADARDLARSVLAQHGAAVTTVASAHEAMREIDRAKPSVLLVDLAMPDVDGYGLLQAVRAEGSAWAHVPAIALTAYAREEDRQRALAHGFQMHIAKPVQAKLLVAAVAAVRGDST